MFIQGNVPWSKGKIFVPRKSEIVLCACGCGGQLNKYDNRNRQRTFLPFHFKSHILGNELYFTSHAGHRHSSAARARISRNRKGKTARERNPNWKGGITPEVRIIRASNRYAEWRRAVFVRDGYKCVLCNATGVLNADHIKPFALYPALRFELSNGRTLCVPCHKATPTYGTRIRSPK